MIKRDGVYVTYDVLLAESEKYRAALNRIIAIFEDDGRTGDQADLLEILDIAQDAIA